jgi:hypothetical protein
MHVTGQTAARPGTIADTNISGNTGLPSFGHR